MSKTSLSKPSKKILVFNASKRFIGVFHSITATATALGCAASNIHNVLTGKAISANNLYFRKLSEEIEIEDSDWGTMRLDEYDKMCGENRLYYPNTNMSRKGMKRNKLKFIKKYNENQASV